MSELLIGWTTCDNSDVAERLAHEIVERDLAACVQIDDEVRSIYKWEGQVQDCSECRLVVKFDAAKLDALNAYIRANHPYEQPEWVVVCPQYVSEKYLNWATGKG